MDIAHYLPEKYQIILSTATLENSLDKDGKLARFFGKEKLQKFAKH